MDAVWKLVVCLMLFCLANFLKAAATKLLSSAFHRTAHFAKVKEALDKVCVCVCVWVCGVGWACIRVYVGGNKGGCLEEDWSQCMERARARQVAQGVGLRAGARARARVRACVCVCVCVCGVCVVGRAWAYAMRGVSVCVAGIMIGWRDMVAHQPAGVRTTQTHPNNSHPSQLTS
jgi:hypothetical protein